jgi:phosphotransferase family enzyme
MSHVADIPASQIATAELRAILERLLSDHFGAPQHITALEHHPSPYQSSFAIEEIILDLDHGTTLQLMLKDVGWQGLLEPARHTKPHFLVDPLREIEVYRRILAQHRLGTALCYGAVVQRRRGRYWLILEKVPGLELYRVGIDIWRQVSICLAGMHGHFATHIDLLSPNDTPHLLRYTGDFYRRWMRRAAAIVRKRVAPSAQERRSIDWLVGRYSQVVELLVALPVTVIHGECYASNMLVEQRANGLRVCPIDWEMAAVGPGTIDLAALIAGSWTDQERMSLALAYHSALMPQSRWRPSPAEFLVALEASQLHLAVQWLGWSSDWSPPPEHAQNWLAVAMRAAEQLEL